MIPVVAVLGLAWAAEHLALVIAMCAVSGVLAVAAVVWLIRFQERREAAAAVERPYLLQRDAPAEVVPAGRRQIAPAIILNFYDAPASQRAEIIRNAIERILS